MITEYREHPDKLKNLLTYISEPERAIKTIEDYILEIIALRKIPKEYIEIVNILLKFIQNNSKNYTQNLEEIWLRKLEAEASVPHEITNDDLLPQNKNYPQTDANAPTRRTAPGSRAGFIINEIPASRKTKILNHNGIMKNYHPPKV
jgi:hypothetical protein